MRFIHTADLGLCSIDKNNNLSSNSASNIKSAWILFYELIDSCKKFKADLLLIAGNLIDNNNTQTSALQKITQAFESIPDTNIIIACGQSDALTQTSLFRQTKIPKNVFIFPSKYNALSLPNLKTTIYGYSWDKSEYEQPPFKLKIKENDDFKILLLHCDTKGNNNKLAINSHSLINTGFNYCALGGSAQKESISNLIHYPGNSMTNTPNSKKGFFMGEVENNKLKFRYIEFDKFTTETIKLKISPEMGYVEIKAKILESSNNHMHKLVSVELVGTLHPQISIESLQNELSQNFASIEIKNLTSYEYDINKLKQQNQNNIVGIYITELMKRAKNDPIARKALYLGVEALLDHELDVKETPNE